VSRRSTDFGHFAPRQIVNFLVNSLTVTLHLLRVIPHLDIVCVAASVTGR
jgi:hypothetical protein